MQTEWLEKDYYQVLGVPETASEKEIQRVYRRLARELHPDANPGNREAEERFKEVSAAYDVLGDAQKRQEYDELRRLGPVAAGFGGDGGFTGFRIDDLGDLFGDLFGGRAARTRGRDVEAELRLEFDEAVSGVTADVQLTGLQREPRTVKVRVPAGVEDGQLIRVPGQGEPGRNGGPAGDLYVVLRVAPHPLFDRRGADLALRVPITYPEAVLGADVAVPTLSGRPLTVRIPPGTPSGRAFRVRGEGVPGLDGSQGDLLVTVEVAVPARVSGKEREAVENLAQVMDASPRAHLGV